ncbi:hypothetical protein ACLI09_17065 [Flavobacterium sp. RHBU_24]|uniref:hypothetical protein n=1 Tax=Flavobacterium sp. RHBU_24 TaxID=3391185 RepID=UPI003985157D
MKKMFLLAGLLLLAACKHSYHTERSFCYWKTNYSSYSIDQKMSDSLEVRHIYMRLFDVGWNPYEKKALPVATLWDFSDTENWYNVTPSVYITNDVFINSSRQQLDELAVNIKTRLNRILEKTEDATVRYTVYTYHIEDSKAFDECQALEHKNFKARIKELMIDCDWTPKSKDNYFYFLSRLKKQVPQLPLSATIRLWQYRDYELAGVPPVSRGLLMCYNMQDPKNRETANSIGSASEMEKYVNHNDYPLKLDAALPIFRWMLAFRGKTLLGIMPEDEVNFDDPLYKKIDDTHYEFTSDKVIGETYYRNGDVIRIERVSDGEMGKMITILKDNIDLEGSRVSFFSWDEKYINDYGIKKISGYYEMFGR